MKVNFNSLKNKKKGMIKKLSINKEVKKLNRRIKIERLFVLH